MQRHHNDKFSWMDAVNHRHKCILLLFFQELSGLKRYKWFRKWSMVYKFRIRIYQFYVCNETFINQYKMCMNFWTIMAMLTKAAKPCLLITMAAESWSFNNQHRLCINLFHCFRWPFPIFSDIGVSEKGVKILLILLNSIICDPFVNIIPIIR